MKPTVKLPVVIPRIQTALSVDLLASRQQLAAVQCTLPAFTPHHAKRWFTEAETILSGALFFDPAHRFLKVMGTKFNMLELMPPKLNF